jgi:hypothetical protein
MLEFPLDQTDGHTFADVELSEAGGDASDLY